MITILFHLYPALLKITNTVPLLSQPCEVGRWKATTCRSFSKLHALVGIRRQVFPVVIQASDPCAALGLKITWKFFKYSKDYNINAAGIIIIIIIIISMELVS